MIIIGEKINGTRKEVGAAIEKRDADFIGDLALRQFQSGATYLDLNAGGLPEREPEDMAWLVETVQEAVPEATLCWTAPITWPCGQVSRRLKERSC